MKVEILSSSIRPVPGGRNLFDKFEEMSLHSDRIFITAGYANVDSVIFLQKNITKLPPMDIVIGMHVFDGFSRALYGACEALHKSMLDKKKGNLRLCCAFPFHGKVYSFWRDGQIICTITGSSNLTCITPDSRNRRVFEVDVALEDPDALEEIKRIQIAVFNKASKDFSEVPAPAFKERTALMEGMPEVEVLSPEQTRKAWAEQRDTSFSLPLKCEKRSNLNVFFGKGRENTKTGLVRPRPWYEIEIIVPKQITDQPGYPRLKTFTVTTDDGYRFEVRTQGDYAKNFRSTGGLTVLGAWIKGRMEAAGVLKPGDFITEDILNRYGRKDVRLTATRDPGRWLLDFSAKK